MVSVAFGCVWTHTSPLPPTTPLAQVKVTASVGTAVAVGAAGVTVPPTLAVGVPAPTVAPADSVGCVCPPVLLPGNVRPPVPGVSALRKFPSAKTPSDEQSTKTPTIAAASATFIRREAGRNRRQSLRVG